MASLLGNCKLSSSWDLADIYMSTNLKLFPPVVGIWSVVGGGGGGGLIKKV